MLARTLVDYASTRWWMEWGDLDWNQELKRL